MRKLNLLILFFLSLVSSYGQDGNRDFNFILVIDDEVWISYTNLKIKIEDKAGSVSYVEGLYYPGNLSFEKESYEKLLTANADSMTLRIDYREYEGKKTKDYIFELPFSPKWLDYYFIVIRVYNMNKKEYKGVFEPLDKDRNYTYEMDYPGGQMLRVRNKVRKKKND